MVICFTTTATATPTTWSSKCDIHSRLTEPNNNADIFTIITSAIDLLIYPLRIRVFQWALI